MATKEKGERGGRKTIQMPKTNLDLDLAYHKIREDVGRIFRNPKTTPAKILTAFDAIKERIEALRITALEQAAEKIRAELQEDGKKLDVDWFFELLHLHPLEKKSQTITLDLFAEALRMWLRDKCTYIR